MNLTADVDTAYVQLAPGKLPSPALSGDERQPLRGDVVDHSSLLVLDVAARLRLHFDNGD